MMEIAICDDQSIVCDELEYLVDQTFSDSSYHYSYQSFLSGDALLTSLDHGSCAFQIYLLDIEMKGTDGLKTAEQIRKQDKDAIIIFITSHGELMSKAFGVLAFAYLIKPLDSQVVVETLQSAIKQLEQRKRLYFYAIRKKVFSVPLVQIEYIESMGRKIRIHMLNGKIKEYNGSLKKTMAKVNGDSFARAHHSFVINLEHIASLESWQLSLRSGAKISIGNRYHEKFHTDYRRFALSYVL